MPRQNPKLVDQIHPPVIRDSWKALAEFEQELTVDQAERLQQMVRDYLDAWFEFKAGPDWKKPDASS